MSPVHARAALLLGVLALLTGCVGMPTEGPVEVSQVDPGAYTAPGSSYDPLPPQAGQSPTEVVGGFLEAMKATPTGTSVARQFLTTGAQDSWKPERGIVTYGELGSTSGQSAVSTELTDVNRYDRRGAWVRTEDDARLDFVLTTEDGEWRIARAPNAMVVPDSWFDDWYQRVSLYYFDPTAQILVPEPVFVPQGDQFASSLVRGLLTAPSEREQGVFRTFFPQGTEPGLSVPITPAGIAKVALDGDPDAVDEETEDRMLAQLVWTLRQEPRIHAVELRVCDRNVCNPGGATQVGLTEGTALDPTVTGATDDLFALQDGRLVRGPLGSLGETFGPLGQKDLAVTRFGVNLSGTTVAAVTGGGSTLLVAPVDQPDGQAAEVLGRAVDLRTPVWDHRDRVWVVDRAGGRARVFMVADAEPREVVVPGITGRDVTELLVSRDGSRLVATVRSHQGDDVVAARVQHDQDGRLLRVLRARPLALPDDDSSRIRDVTWRTPTAVSVLFTVTSEQSEVRTVSVDGAPGEIATEGSTRPRGLTSSLVSSPAEGSIYAVSEQTITDLTTPELELGQLPRGLRRLSYAG